MRLTSLSIRHLLLGAFLLTSLLPTTLVTGMAFFEARTALKTEIQHDLETRANATADDIDRVMFERLQNLASWGRLEIMQDIRIGDVDKRLSRFLSELKSSYHNVYRTLYVTDLEGRIVASSDAATLGNTLADPAPWISTRLSGIDIRLARPDNGKLLISAEIQDDIDKKRLGLLVAEFNWQEITDILSNSVSGRTSAAMLDEQEQVLAATALWQDTVKARITASAATQGFQGLTSTSWHVVLVQHRDEALAPIRKMGFIFIILLLITVLLASFIAIPVAKTITVPLGRLTEFALRLMRNPGRLEPPTGGPPEIDTMSRAFGQMIEDLERSREHLTRAAKLAVAGEMAAAMSHEVRTPLGILRSSAQVLLREPGLSQEGREVCGFIISETDRLNKLVSTLIDSSRPRAPEFLPVNLSELAQQAVAMLRMQAEEKQVTLQCEAPSEATAECDREQMTQVLLNLVLNSIQVVAEGGHVQVTVQPSDGHILITVADDGPGIPESQRLQVFDPFFSKRSGGIGLGLAIVRQIMEAHQGEIEIGTSAMQGAEFRLKLPVYLKPPV